MVRSARPRRPRGGRLWTEVDDWLVDALGLVDPALEAALAESARAGLPPIQVSPPQGQLLRVLAELAGPFDLVFIDADKPALPDYLAWTLRLTRPGSLIVADNVIRKGRVVDAASTAADAGGVRQFLTRLGSDPRLHATAIQTVGAKGYDGLATATVVADTPESRPESHEP